jgi:vacuolar-type H+-ATPase subunit H
MTQQIANALTGVSLPDDVADRMIGQIEAERDSSKNVIEDAKHKARKEIAQLDRKLDRLTVAYLDAGAFSAAEFRKRKEESIGKKRTLLDSLVSLDEEENQRFEPVIRFLNGSKQMKYVASRGNPKELR